MRVHTRVEIDMATGEVLDEEGFDYEGPIAECKGGGGGEVSETPEEKELARIASEKWDRYQDVFVPLENQYMDEVDRMGTQGAMDEVTGQAASTTQQGVGEMPVNPNEGAPMGGIGSALGSARAGAVSRAGTGLRGQEIAGKQGLVAMGQGQSAEAMQGLGDVATQAAQEAQGEAFRDFNRRNAWANLAGQAAGMGLSYGMGNSGSGIAGPQQRQGLAAQNQGNDFFQYGTNQALRSNRGGM